MATVPRRLALGGAAAALAVAGAAVFLACRGSRPPPEVANAPSPAPPAAATYVGREACRSCHGRETALWAGSHHQLAMQVASAETVLGDFGGARFTYHGVTTTFSKQGGEFRVSTDGPDGKIHDYRVAYTFGVSPLEQFLIPFPDGRYQALNVCWDTRPKEKGGQRWFHLYPAENISSSNILHWTGLYQNWNFMCAECHSTNVRKGYDPAAKTFRTTWSEINVSCESCHGPGSAHLAWAAARRLGEGERGGSDGLAVRLKEETPSTWILDPTTGTARRSAPLASRVEVETCARCHSRRATISEDYVFGRPLLDTHRPELLDGSLFFADGQIDEEDYEYQSFLQSRMYAEGVTCSDCHNPHALALPDPPDAVCGRCHAAPRFATPAHHFHRPNSAGSSCIACHMPAKDYMVVHRRHDHGFRVPRPDLTLKIGVPNTCTSCHRGRTAKWAAEAALRWWGGKRLSTPHFGEALVAGREALAGAPEALAALAGDESQPAIARASAIRLLRRYGRGAVPAVVARALSSDDPTLRFAAVSFAGDIAPSQRAALLDPLLDDPVRSIRMDAARALAGRFSESLTGRRRDAFAKALTEYRQAQALNADRPEAHLNLGGLALDLGDPAAAETEYRKALEIEPRFPATYVNLADLYRSQGRDAEGETVLQRGLARAADTGGIELAYGLLLVRIGRPSEALGHLARAAALRPGDAHYAFVYGVALNSAGDGRQALEILRKSAEKHTGDAELLSGLATISRERGRMTEALAWARRLAAAFPQDTAARRLLDEIEATSR